MAGTTSGYGKGPSAAKRKQASTASRQTTKKTGAGSGSSDFKFASGKRSKTKAGSTARSVENIMRNLSKK